MVERVLPPRQGLMTLVEPLPEPPSVAFGDAFQAGYLRQYSPSALLMDQPDFDEDPEYLPENDEANAGYPSHAIVDAVSAEHAASIRTRVDKEREDLRQINESWGGVVGEIAGALLSPETLVGGVIGASGKVGFRTAAVADTALVGAGEAALHEAQLLRTAEESLMNVGITYGGQVLLGKAGLWWQGKREEAATNAQAREMIETYFKPATDDDGITLPSPAADGGSVGAMAAKEGEADDWGLTGGWLTNKLAVGPLKNVMKSSSEAARKLGLRMVENPFFTKAGEKEGRSAGVSVEAFTNASIGRTAQAIDDAKKLQKDSGMNPNDFDEAVGVALSNGDRSANPQVQLAAQNYRKNVLLPLEQEAKEFGLLPRTQAEVEAKILTDVGEARAEETAAAMARYKAAKEAGDTDTKLIIEGIEPNRIKEWEKAPVKLAKGAESYFTRIYRRDKIFENYGALTRLLRSSFEEAGLEGAAAKEAAQDAIDNMLGGLPLVNPVKSVGGKQIPDSVRARVIQLTDDQLAPYKENRASVALLQHSMGLSPHIQFKRVFGDFDFQEEVKKVQDQYQTLKTDAKNAKERKKIQVEEEKVLTQLARLENRVMNRIIHAEEFGGMNMPAAKAVKIAQAWNVSAQLGGIVLSSLPDVMRPLAQYGLRSYAAGIASYGKYIFQKGSEAGIANKAAVRRTGVAIERIRNQKLLDTVDMEEGSEKVSNLLGRYWGKITLFNLYTDVMEHITAQTGAHWTLRLGKKLQKGGKLSRAEMGQITRMGLEPSDLKDIAAEHNRIGSPGGELLSADTLKWQDKKLALKFEAAIGSDVRRTILRIGAADKPLFMDTLTWKWLLQYQSFLMASANRMLVAGLQQRDLKMGLGILASVYLGSQVRATKAWLRDDDPNEWSESKWLAEGIDGSGVLGVYGIGLRAAMVAMGDVPARYLNRDVEGYFGGPTVSTAGNILRSGQAALEGDWEKAYEKGIRAVPGANTWHARQLLEKSMGETE